MKAFPSLKGELQAKPRAAKASKGNLSDQDVEENTHVLAAKWVGGKAEAASIPGAGAKDLVSVRGYIPEYLDRELAIKAATDRVTKTYLILDALQKAGYHVADADMRTDRRRDRT